MNQCYCNPQIFIQRMSKVCKTVQEALRGLKDNNQVLIGGFGICGIAMNLINGVRESGVKNLFIVSNTAGIDNWGVGALIRKPGLVKRVMGSYVGENKQFERQYLAGELEVELVPQGTLAQKMRAGGAGIPAFFTPAGVNTLYSTGRYPIKLNPQTKEAEILSKVRQMREFKGRQYIMEETLFGDFALIKAWKADKKGNLIFRKTAQNFNSDMATAAKVVVAEVEEIVETGELDPNQIHIPAVYVNRLYQQQPGSQWNEKRIERTVIKKPGEALKTSHGNAAVRNKIAARAALEIKDGMALNLGIGIANLIPSHLPPNIKIDIHSENGIMGVGDYPGADQVDPDLINAGKETITADSGAAYFSSSMAFDIIRGTHLDMTFLGGLQVSARGDISNWIIPGKMVRGMGGAMDLVASRSKVVVVMEHTAKGEKKLLQENTLPLTAEQVVSMVITEKAVFVKQNDRLVLTEVAKQSSLEQVKALTGFKFEHKDNLKTF